jgi:hypothetical protein
MSMDALGFGVVELIILLIVLVFFLGLPILTLIDLARKKLAGTSLAIWVLIICIVPLLGSLAYWIIKPTTEGQA